MTDGSENSKPSETTGPQRVGNALPSVIGMPPSESGVERCLPASEREHWGQNLIFEADDPGRTTRNLLALLSQQHGCSPRMRNERGGWAMVLNMPDFEAAILAVKRQCCPAPKRTILEELVTLRSQCAVRDGQAIDMEIQAGIYAEKLLQYPADCVVFVLRKWPSKSRWWPTWFELETDLKAVASGRMALVPSLESIERQWLAEQRLA